jgi:hypothetical protein
MLGLTSGEVPDWSTPHDAAVTMIFLGICMQTAARLGHSVICERTFIPSHTFFPGISCGGHIPQVI